MRKVLSFILVLIVLVSSITISNIVSFANEQFETASSDSKTTVKGKCGLNVTWTYDLETATLTISGTGEMEWCGPTAEGGYPRASFSRYRNDIKKIIINEGITEIGGYAFEECVSFTELVIPSSVKVIQDNAFQNCTGLQNIIFEDGIEAICDSAFTGCTNLKNIDFGNTLTHIYFNAFNGCTSLENISIPQSVSFVDAYAFHNTAFSNNDENWHNGALYIDGILASVKPDVTGDFVVADGTRLISGLSFYNKKISTISFPTSLKIINEFAFWGCSSLTSVDIPNGVTEIGWRAFGNDVNLSNVRIPKSVTTIVNDVFHGCHKLVITCVKDSYAHQYAIENKIPYQFMDVSVKEKGMQFRIDNLEDVKTIRYAYGEYDNERDIKYGEDAVSHSGKTLRNRGDSCVLQFPKAGLVSIVITYNDGSCDFYKYEVIKSEPTVTREGNEITFGNLDDLKVLRYAKGEYDSSYDIKRAEDSVAISGKTLTSDTYTVILEPGTYTFCVQYNDESYNYYTFDFKG